MIRFKVIRASRLLLAVAIVALAAVLGLLGYRLLSSGSAPPVSGSANLVQAVEREGEAETASVFASSGDGARAAASDAGKKIEIQIVESVAPRPKAAPRVLIYHTHTHEAYEQVSDDPYDALEAWRTADTDHSVVRVGEELARDLRGRGFEVVHDETDHEGDQLSTAYTRSLDTLKGYDAPFDLYIDLHRDAYVQGEAVCVADAGGNECAPLMLLIGNGNGFDEKPYYRENYAFARALTDRVNGIQPGLCRPVMVKDGRYNQHIGVFAVLVEVGHNRNTLGQALNSVSPLAQAIDDLMQAHPDPELASMKAAYAKKQTDVG